MFTPNTSTVDVAVSAQYISPQYVEETVCTSEVYDVLVGIDSMTVVSSP
jgi:hypothetical protein